MCFSRGYFDNQGSIMETYRPKFHKDNTVTYWSDKYQRWYHRVHPSLIPGSIVKSWNVDNRRRLNKAYNNLGYYFDLTYREWRKI